MTRLYQWLHARATSFYAWGSSRSGAHTLRTAITVRHQERTLLVCGHGQLNPAICPLCGQALSDPSALGIQTSTQPSSTPADESPAALNQSHRGSLQ
jgi:hypothetical protein